MNKFGVIFFLFFLLTPIGTLLHETGHYLAAQYYEVSPKLHYNRTTIENNLSRNINLIIVLWGILSTVIIGSLGFYLALKYRLKLNTLYCGIYLAFFWSREIVSLFISFFVKRDFLTDEVVVAKLLGLPDYTVAVLLGISAIIILSYCVFILLPKNLRFKFILGGVLGSISGWLFWFLFLGPIVLP